jgi:hypothetical protein
MDRPEGQEAEASKESRASAPNTLCSGGDVASAAGCLTASEIAHIAKEWRIQLVVDPALAWRISKGEVSAIEEFREATGSERNTATAVAVIWVRHHWVAARFRRREGACSWTVLDSAAPHHHNQSSWLAREVNRDPVVAVPIRMG